MLRGPSDLVSCKVSATDGDVATLAEPPRVMRTRASRGCYKDKL